MSALLLANAAATLFMTGLIWLVQVVHYPLFARVGEREFPAFHAEHSRRITPVVLPVMTIELVSSILLVFARPPGVGAAAVWAGAALAVAVWASTATLQGPAHRRLGAALDRRRIHRLVTVNWVRTAAWTAHSAVVIGMLAAAG